MTELLRFLEAAPDRGALCPFGRTLPSAIQTWKFRGPEAREGADALARCGRRAAWWRLARTRGPRSGCGTTGPTYGARGRRGEAVLRARRREGPGFVGEN